MNKIIVSVIVVMTFASPVFAGGATEAQKKAAQTARDIAHVTQSIADTEHKQADPSNSANKQVKLAAELDNEQDSLATLTGM